MNKFLDPKLTKYSGKEEKKNQTIEKQDIDTMFSWNGVSLFDTEDNALKSEYTPTATKDMDLTISKIKRLQNNVKRQEDVSNKDKPPKLTTFNPETEPIIEPVKLAEDVEEENVGKDEEVKEEIPTENQPTEEKEKSTGERKTSTPPFLLTLEILNHKVHNCLVDSGSSVNVMPLAICKKT